MLLRSKTTATQVSRRAFSRSSRRHASHSPPNASESALHVAGGSGSESFGKGFYITLILVPIGLVGWTFAASSDTGSRFSGLIHSYVESRHERDQRRNALHEAAAEQAAFDRHLFDSATPSYPGVELRFPEALNRVSPWNVVAGEGGADLTKLMEHYSRENEKAEQERLSRVKDGKVTTVYDDTTGGRFPSWVPLVGSSKKVAPGYKE